MQPGHTTIKDWDLSTFMATIHEGRVGLWSWNPVERFALLDGLARQMWGGLEGERHSIDTLFERVHEDDREAMQAAWWASTDTDDAYEFDFRVGPPGGPYRWVSARGAGGAAGRSGDDLLAVFVDVTRLHEATETRDRLIREMAHRTANLFTVAQSMARLAGADAEDADALSEELGRRFAGLADAYRFGVTRTGQTVAAPLSEIASRILAPFGQDAMVHVALPDAPVQGDQVTNLAVVLHELATNAVKYGALSVPGGTLTLEGERDGDVIALRWREAGGPHLSEVPHPTGFGSKLIGHTVTSAFGGTIARRIEGGALHVDLTLDARRLAG